MSEQRTFGLWADYQGWHVSDSASDRPAGTFDKQEDAYAFKVKLEAMVASAGTPLNDAKAATIAALQAENIRLRGEVGMYKGALEMMQPAPKEQAEHGMGAMPPVPDDVAQLRAEVERAKTIIENYELDYDRVVVRGEKCAMELAVEEAATLRAEVERLKEQNSKLTNSLAVRNQECNAARSAMVRQTTDPLKDYVNYKEARAATDADGGCE